MRRRCLVGVLCVLSAAAAVLSPRAAKSSSHAEAFVKVVVRMGEGVRVSGESSEGAGALVVGDERDKIWGRSVLLAGTGDSGDLLVLQSRDTEEGRASLYGVMSGSKQDPRIQLYTVTWPE